MPAEFETERHRRNSENPIIPQFCFHNIWPRTMDKSLIYPTDVRHSSNLVYQRTPIGLRKQIVTRNLRRLSSGQMEPICVSICQMLLARRRRRSGKGGGWWVSVARRSTRERGSRNRLSHVPSRITSRHASIESPRLILDARR